MLTTQLGQYSNYGCCEFSQDKEINGADDVNKFQSGEEEEDKEQCSPVSVLDPPFHDDDDDVHDNDHGEKGFDLNCSYANVQSMLMSSFYYIVFYLLIFLTFYVVWSFSINMPSYTVLQS